MFGEKLGEASIQVLSGKGDGSGASVKILWAGASCEALGKLPGDGRSKGLSSLGNLKP